MSQFDPFKDFRMHGHSAIVTGGASGIASPAAAAGAAAGGATGYGAGTGAWLWRLMRTESSPSVISTAPSISSAPGSPSRSRSRVV